MLAAVSAICEVDWHIVVEASRWPTYSRRSLKKFLRNSRRRLKACPLKAVSHLLSTAQQTMATPCFFCFFFSTGSVGLARDRQPRGLRRGRRRHPRGADRAGPGPARLIRTRAVTFKALDEPPNGLHDLIVELERRLRRATASRDEALAETFSIFPTFLDESKTTLARLQGVRQRHAPARPGPAAGGGRPGPDGARPRRPGPRPEAVFNDLDPLIDVSNENLPEAVRFLDCARDGGNCPMGGDAPGLFEGLNVFLEELNPFLAYVELHAGAARGLHLIRRRDAQWPLCRRRRRGPPAAAVRHQQRRARSGRDHAPELRARRTPTARRTT